MRAAQAPQLIPPTTSSARTASSPALTASRPCGRPAQASTSRPARGRSGPPAPRPRGRPRPPPPAAAGTRRPLPPRSPGHHGSYHGRVPVPLRTHPAESIREIELSVTGMTCAACAARVQKKLTKLDGVTASVNYATGAAHVTAPAAIPVETLTTAVEAAGYTAQLATPDDDSDSAAARHTADLWHRLIGALGFFVPLTDLSLTLSLIPSVRFPGWPW